MCETYDIKDILSVNDDIDNELAALNIKKGAGIYERIYTQDALIVRSLMLGGMNIIWPIFDVPTKVSQSIITSIYSSA
jgi:hypothetical protein